MPKAGRDDSKVIFDPKGNLVSSEQFREPSLWGDRLKNATEYYEAWASKFQVEDLENAYYGFQWDQTNLPDGYKAYVNNLFFIAIDTKMPALMFQNPIFTVKPLPLHAEFDPATASINAKIKEDTLNYFVVNDRIQLTQTIELAILDAFFRFGVIEVGYSADWVDNPRGQKPHLAADDKLQKQHTGETLSRPKRLPQAERVYTKYIPSKNFRVGGLDTQNLEECSWYGYWEYVRIEDVLSNKKFDIDKISLGASVSRSTDFMASTRTLQDEEEILERQGDLIKWWKIWDLRSKKRVIYLEESNKIIRETSFKRIPHHILKFRHRLRGFYPLPLTYSWISPQTEANEVREAGRAHRRRFQRKYILASGAFDNPGELEKLQNGGDGTIVQSSKNDARLVIAPVPNADLGAQHMQALQVSTDDFDTVAGISAEQKGKAADATATAAKIVNARASIRESRDTNQVRQFIISVGGDVLNTVRDKFVNEFWVEITGQKTAEEPFGLLQENIAQWKQISPEMFGDEDFQLNIDVASLSPIINDQEKEKYIEFISLMQSFPFLSLSPALVRETADKVGYTNSKVLGVFQQMAQLNQIGQMQQNEQGAEAEGAGRQAQKVVAQNSPNTQQQITNQLRNQGG